MTTKAKDCSFEIIDAVKQRATILGTQDPGTHEFGDPPAPLKKGEELQFVGKWPLESYVDNGREIFTFTTALGVVVNGTLIGFTVDCTAPYSGRGRSWIRMRIRFT